MLLSGDDFHAILLREIGSSKIKRVIPMAATVKLGQDNALFAVRDRLIVPSGSNFDMDYAEYPIGAEISAPHQHKVSVPGLTFVRDTAVSASAGESLRQHRKGHGE